MLLYNSQKVCEMSMTIREAEKLLKDAGFVEVKGGKGHIGNSLKRIILDPLSLSVKYMIRNERSFVC